MGLFDFSRPDLEKMAEERDFKGLKEVLEQEKRYSLKHNFLYNMIITVQ
jgi:hypothetical protein